MTEMALNF